jgi:hypothetical protein
MILQSGTALQIDTILTLIGTIDFQTSKNIKSKESAIFEYRKFLLTLKQRPVSLTTTIPTFGNDSDSDDALARLFANKSLLDDRGQDQVISGNSSRIAHENKNMVLAALDRIAVKSPLHYTFFSFLITDILFRPSAIARGGSTSRAIGLIWLNLKKDYSVDDVAEILIHELTHHSLFLDELRFSHYNYEEILDPHSWARSAILKIPRPLDKVLHSIIVAIEVLLLRDRCIGHPSAPRIHPPTETLIAQVLESIESVHDALMRAPKAFRNRANVLIREATDTALKLAVSARCDATPSACPRAATASAAHQYGATRGQQW